MFHRGHSDDDGPFVPITGEGRRLGCASDSGYHHDVTEHTKHVFQYPDRCTSLMKSLEDRTIMAALWCNRLAWTDFAGQLWEDCNEWTEKAVHMSNMYKNMVNHKIPYDWVVWCCEIQDHFDVHDRLEVHVTAFLTPHWVPRTNQQADEADDVHMGDEPIPTDDADDVGEQQPDEADDVGEQQADEADDGGEQQADEADEPTTTVPKRRRMRQKTPSGEMLVN